MPKLVQLTNGIDQLYPKVFRNGITVTSLTAQSINNEFVQLQLDKILGQVGNKLTLNSNKIIVGKGITKVLIAGSIWYDNVTNGYIYSYLRCNNQNVAQCIVDGSQFYKQSIVPVVIIEVKEKDTIDIFTQYNSSIKANTRKEGTYLTVLDVS